MTCLRSCESGGDRLRRMTCMADVEHKTKRPHQPLAAGHFNSTRLAGILCCSNSARNVVMKCVLHYQSQSFSCLLGRLDMNFFFSTSRVFRLQEEGRPGGAGRWRIPTVWSGIRASIQSSFMGENKWLTLKYAGWSPSSPSSSAPRNPKMYVRKIIIINPTYVPSAAFTSPPLTCLNVNINSVPLHHHHRLRPRYPLIADWLHLNVYPPPLAGMMWAGGGNWQDSHRTPKHRNMYALAAALGPVCLPALTPKEMLIYGENKEKGKCWETRRRFSDVSKWSWQVERCQLSKTVCQYGNEWTRIPHTSLILLPDRDSYIV